MMPVAVFVGTRPEAIKMAPVVRALRNSSVVRPVLCATGQHKEMVQQVLADFDLQPDLELDVMQPGQTLSQLSSRLFECIPDVLRAVNPQLVMVQGDTTTVMIAGMVSFYLGIPVAHVEAGLRSGNLDAPFPEEFNRRVTSLYTKLHFAPTQRAADNLLNEGVSPETVHVTGNTVVDALLYIRDKVRLDPPPLPESVERCLNEGKKLVLVTGHRRENFGTGQLQICAAIQQLACEFSDTRFVYPVHLNPAVQSIVYEQLGNHPGVLLIEPLGYRAFIRLMDVCQFIISDSGGIQEEAPSFGKKVLVTRHVTERPEGVATGICQLVGTDRDTIVHAAREILQNPLSQSAVFAANPYGDGRAALAILQLVERFIRNR